LNKARFVGTDAFYINRRLLREEGTGRQNYLSFFLEIIATKFLI